MKKLTMLVFLSFLTLSIFSQEYYQLIKEERSWSVMTVIPTGEWPPFDTTFFTINYYISGDSSLNNLQYKRIFSSREEIPTNWNLIGLIREDSNKNIWYKRIVDENEVQLYNFTLNAGDSLKLGFDTSFYYYVDSVTTCAINETQRKKYWISSVNDWHETWIEGIGSNKGIINSASASMVGGWTWSLCESDSGELIYQNPNYESCYLVTDINENKKPIIQIYPNPAKNLLTIKNGGNIKIKSITLSNTSGRIIKRFDSGKTRLGISKISSGLYILKIFYETGTLTKKILIE